MGRGRQGGRHQDLRTGHTPMDGCTSQRFARQPVIARNVVATSQPLASQAGAAAFARGGNAIDAALAAAVTLTVVEPTMNGIGGDAFALVWDGQTLQGLNASGRAPAAWSPDRKSTRLNSSH